MAQVKGRVEFFDPKRRFGKINPDSGGELVFVHCSAILSQREYALVPGESVEFDLEKGERGPVAKNVRRLETRCSGKVEYFDRKRGIGLILPDTGDGEIFVHYSDIVSQKEYKSLEDGEQVDYTLVESEGRRKATRVLPDTRTPLERFAFLASFDRKLQSLATMAPEDWELQVHRVEARASDSLQLHPLHLPAGAGGKQDHLRRGRQPGGQAYPDRLLQYRVDDRIL